MLNRFLPMLAAAVLVATPASAAPAKQPSPDLQFALHCSAAFAIAASEQQRGVASAQAFPPLGGRGREFFVRTGARLMDELSLTRAQLQARLQQEVGHLQAETAVATNPQAAFFATMQPCLTLLDATIPADAGRAR